MNVQLKKMTAACVLALGAVSGSALAYGPGTTPDVTIYVGGASAQDSVFVGLIRGFMSGNIDEYYDNATVEATPATTIGFTSSDGTNFRAVFGQWAADGSDLASKKVLVVKRSAGGSYWGVAPIANNEAVKFMNISPATCTLGGVSTVANKYVCDIGKGTSSIIPITATNLIDAVPDVGLSDVEPALFTDLVNQPGTADFTGDPVGTPFTDASSLASKSLFAVGFGAQVNALNPVTGITKQQYASIATGAISNWNQIDPALGSHTVVLCRRTNGSGTQAMSNAYFLNTACGNSQVPADSGFGARIVENVATGNVRTCIAGDPWAIGWLSLEDNLTGVTTRKWVPVAGVSVPNPTSPGGATCSFGACNTDNMKNGKSDMYAEQSFNKPLTLTSNSKRSDLELQAFIDKFETESVKASVLLPRSKAGILALASETAGGNVMDFTRSGNSCAPSNYGR
jgi:ABC-type phosphate transport system substrate-binding protein